MTNVLLMPGIKLRLFGRSSRSPVTILTELPQPTYGPVHDTCISLSHTRHSDPQVLLYLHVGIFHEAGDKRHLEQRRIPVLEALYLYRVLHVYSRINTTKCPASGAGNVTNPRLMSQTARVCEVVIISVFLQSELWRCQY